MVEQLVAKDDELKSILTIRNFTNQFDMSIVEWIIAMKRGLSEIEKYPQHIMPMRYEDLVANPEKVVKEICTFCNLDEDAKLINYAKEILKPVPSKKLCHCIRY
ncbi:MAG: sulfotransferase [Bacteroidetes bacterium]|nr:sulfotransferase [Bacteroidota bacterium]